MSTDLRDKLRRLGVHKGTAKIAPSLNLPRERRGRQAGIESLVDGREIDTPYGPAFVHEETYAADHAHGGHALGDVLGLSSAVAAQIGNVPELEQVDLGRVGFLDTETTGLAGGTGTYAFLVGLGSFTPALALRAGAGASVPHPAREAFILRQFFLRSPAEEPAMLHALAGVLDSLDAVVSFNGRGFDMPLLDTRFRLAHMRPRILRAPHLDLLMPARRVWRGRLESCALSSLERHILDVRREQADVPGWMIPGMYIHYVETGDASEMPRVLYHNTLDILSMVSLSTHLIKLFADSGERDAGDLLALGKWHADLGQAAEAESALRQCLECQPDPATRFSALHRLGQLLKRSGRRDEAVDMWEVLSKSKSAEGIEACVELAKHSEWRAADFGRAIKWTRKAIAIVHTLPPGYARDQLDADLAHRLARLERKMC